MLGTFQHSHLRIELDASHLAIRDSLIHPEKFRRWLWPQTFSADLSYELKPGDRFQSYLGPIEVHHVVDRVNDMELRLLMSRGIDGFHEWQWGDGWVQSRLEGVSLLPLNLGQTLNLARFREYLRSTQSQQS